MAVGSPALLLAPMVDSSVVGHGYYSYFLISKLHVCALAARLVQRLLFGRVSGDRVPCQDTNLVNKGSRGATPPW